MKEEKKASADDFKFFVLDAEAKAKEKFNKIMKKYGKRSGSGFLLDIHSFLKACEEMEREKGDENETDN